MAEVYARWRRRQGGPRKLLTTGELWERYRHREYYRRTRVHRCWLKKMRRVYA